MLSRNPTSGGCRVEGVCNEVELDCHPCCRCIPQGLCAKFEAEDCTCQDTDLLELDGNNEYVGSISCAGETMDLRVSLHRENDTCYWRVVSEAFYIDELFPIGVSQVGCTHPHLEVEAPFYECPGTVTIKKHVHRTLELLPDEHGCAPLCTDCRCACECLCITYEDDDGCMGGAEACWDEYEGGWRAEIDCGEDYPIEVVITLECLEDEYTGERRTYLMLSTSKGDAEPLEANCPDIGAVWEIDIGNYRTAMVTAVCRSCDECPGITTPCCGPTTLPRTLHVSVNDDVCGPGPGGTVTWNGEYWIGYVDVIAWLGGPE